MWLLWLMRSDAMRWGQLCVIHMDWKKRRRAMFSATGRRDEQANTIDPYCTYIFLNPQMLLSIQRKLFFLMTLLLNGKMNPGDPLSTPLSSLCSASILIKSWAHIPSFFADPLPVSSQLTIDKKSFSLTCLGVHHIQFWEKITKSKEKKPSFPTPPQHITVIYVDYISFSRRV